MSGVALHTANVVAPVVAGAEIIMSSLPAWQERHVRKHFASSLLNEMIS